jgi:hypothetical protein
MVVACQPGSEDMKRTPDTAIGISPTPGMQEKLLINDK